MDISHKLVLAILRARGVYAEYTAKGDPRPPDIVADDMTANHINATLDNYEALNHANRK